MNEVINITRGSGITMSSREIALLCDKQHSHVRRDIAAMLEQLGEKWEGYVQNWTDPQNGRSYEEYALPKRECLILVSGYSVEIRARIIDRWIELENGLGGRTIAVPDFSDPVAAARAWADQFEARRIAEQTKAEIGTRREATAMNTASQAVKKANKLERELDRAREYASVKRMSMLYHGQEFSWRELKHVSIEMGVLPIDVFDANYGTVKAYHADVWRETYALEIPQVEGRAA